MQTVQDSPYRFDVVNAGVDWMTATGRGRVARRQFDAVGESIIKDKTDAGVEVLPASVRDYSGYRVPGVFYGRRREDSIIVLTGAGAPPNWKRVAQSATNVSRLDLQVTVWTHGEQPALSRWYYQRVRRSKPKRGRPRSYSLIQTHPHGDTLYVGKRTSDCFGRVYDYATAHSEAPPRTLWRYEVEFKRDLALRHSNALLAHDAPGGYAESVVGAWYQTRDIYRTWCAGMSHHSDANAAERRETDQLQWFRDSLSKTVAKAIRSHGVEAVLDALNLSHIVIPCPRKE